jgi:hypothetical protein
MSRPVGQSFPENYRARKRCSWLVDQRPALAGGRGRPSIASQGVYRVPRMCNWFREKPGLVSILNTPHTPFAGMLALPGAASDRNQKVQSRRVCLARLTLSGMEK